MVSNTMNEFIKKERKSLVGRFIRYTDDKDVTNFEVIIEDNGESLKSASKKDTATYYSKFDYPIRSDVWLMDGSKDSPYSKYYVKTFPKNIEKAIEYDKEVQAHNKKVENLESYAENRVNLYVAEVDKILEERAFNTFIGNFGDARNWEYHKPKAKIAFVNNDESRFLEYAFEYIYADSVRFPREKIIGKTIKDFYLRIWREFGLVDSKERRDDIYWGQFHFCDVERLVNLVPDYIIFPKEGEKND